MNPVLTATVVHDLKNALGVLVSQLAGLESDAGEGPLERQAMHAHAVARQLSAKLVAFLTLYRASSSGLTLQTSDHNAEDFLRDLATSLVLPPGAPSIAVTIDEELPPFWFFDAYLTGLALEAAVQNAVRFAHSRITLSTHMRNGFLLFRVQDDGPGLGAQGAPSTGLGTELCRAIAHAHKDGERTGKVVLKNVEPQGARFELWLP
jgi:signal transduction histidine kinase